VEIITKKPCWLKSRATAGLAAQHVELMAKNQDVRFEAGRFRHSRLPQHVAGLSRKVGSAPLRRNSMFLSRQVKRAPFYNCSKALQCALTQKIGITLALLRGSAPEMGLLFGFLAERVGCWQCAPKARIISGGRFHP
jgi:hypothetical protein